MTARKELLLKYNQMVPRYTSYPTAPHFKDMDARTAEEWLGKIPPGSPVSLYLHIPYCREMCWYCGCHTSATRKYAPVRGYVDLLTAEIGLVSRAIGRKPSISHLHFGGGSPSMLESGDFSRIMEAIFTRFDRAPNAELAIETDPRGVTEDRVRAYARHGINRASFGLQDFTPAVQEAINRVQDFATVKKAVDLFRAEGIGRINFDLMYGLPKQTADNLLHSIDLALELAPRRIALFGYAHVPWMKKHMRLIRDEDLPGASERLDQFEAAAERLAKSGYRAVGLDHFVTPGDDMAAALDAHTLSRNFQGYTTDQAPTLIGLGASAISRYAQGYLQNAANIVPWREALEAGRLPTARGAILSDDDRLRAKIISDLMCTFSADIPSVLEEYGLPEDHLDATLDALADLEKDGAVTRDGRTITVNPGLRQIVRVVAARFDRYFIENLKRHAQAA